MNATFNSIRQAEQARAELLRLGLSPTHIELGELQGSSPSVAPSDPTPLTTDLVRGSAVSAYPLDLSTTLPSREYLNTQIADPTLSGALIGGGLEGYNAPDSEMQNADFNRNEQDAGLYWISLDLEGSSLTPDAVKQVLERLGGRLSAMS